MHLLKLLLVTERRQGETSSLNSHLVVLRSLRVCISPSLWVISTLNHSIDGVTVAKSIQLKDKFENLGARSVVSYF